MSTIREKIQEEVKIAMKAREQHRLETLRGLFSEIKKTEIDSRGGAGDGQLLSDEQVIQLLQREVKKRRDAIEFAKNAGRTEIVESNQQEVNWIQAFLGEQLSEDALRKIIQDLVASGADNLGKVMGELNKQHKGKFEGRVASEIAKGLFAA